MKQPHTPNNIVHFMSFDNQDFVAFPVSSHGILSPSEWEEIIEDILDSHAIAEYRKAPKQETYPSEFVHKLLDCETTGSRIKEWRKYRNLTQETLADKAGIDRSYLSDIERDKRNGTTKTLKAIAKALKCDLDDLV